MISGPKPLKQHIGYGGCKAAQDNIVWEMWAEMLFHVHLKIYVLK